MRIAVWAGSLGSESANQAALRVASRWLANARAPAELVVGPDQIPPFRAAQVDEPPVAVARFRRSIEAADAVLIAAPEYAGGLAGVAKNSLDWLVGSGSLYHKLVGVLSVGTTGGVVAREQLIRTLSWQGALTVAELGIESPRTKMTNGEFSDAVTIAAIEAWVADVIIANRLAPAQLLERVGEFVTPLGIDVARFGDAGARSA